MLADPLLYGLLCRWIVEGLIQSGSVMTRHLRCDLLALGYRKADLITMIMAFFMNPGFSAACLHRLSASCTRNGLGKLAFSFRRLNGILNSCDIDPRAVVGPGLNLPHPTGIVIGPVIIGNNVTIHQNVSMGRRRTEDAYTGPESRPNVGDDVVIYAGAVILGGVRIGCGARIGANAVVTQDVPENCSAVGVPARIAFSAGHKRGLAEASGVVDSTVKPVECEAVAKQHT